VLEERGVKRTFLFELDLEVEGRHEVHVVYERSANVGRGVCKPLRDLGESHPLPMASPSSAPRSALQHDRKLFAVAVPCAGKAAIAYSDDELAARFGKRCVGAVDAAVELDGLAVFVVDVLAA